MHRLRAKIRPSRWQAMANAWPLARPTSVWRALERPLGRAFRLAKNRNGLGATPCANRGLHGMAFRSGFATGGFSTQQYDKSSARIVSTMLLQSERFRHQHFGAFSAKTWRASKSSANLEYRLVIPTAARQCLIPAHNLHVASGRISRV